MEGRVGKCEAELESVKQSWKMGNRVGKWETELESVKQSWKV